MVGCVTFMSVLTSNSWCPSCGINFAVRHFFYFEWAKNNDTTENDIPRHPWCPDSSRLCKIISSTSSLEKTCKYNDDTHA